MRRFLTSGALTIALSLSSSIAAHASACTPTLVTSIDLVVTPEGRALLAPVRLNQRQTFFLVDTGGILSTVRYDVANELGLPMEDAPFGMVNIVGQRLDRQATVEHFGLGQLDYGTARLIVEPEHDMAGGMHGPISGTLSPDVMRNFDTEFDITAGKLNLFKPTDCVNPAYWSNDATEVKFAIDGGHIRFPMRLDGKPVDAMLDTGMSLTSLDLRAAQEKFGVDLNADGVERLGRLAYTEESQTYRYQFKTLTFPNSGYREDKPTIRLMPDLMSASMENGGTRAALILGLTTIQHMRIYIAYKRQALYVTPASGPPAAFRPPGGIGSEPNSLRNPPH